jgi:hypothetical protein
MIEWRCLVKSPKRPPCRTSYGLIAGIDYAPSNLNVDRLAYHIFHTKPAALAFIDRGEYGASRRRGRKWRVRVTEFAPASGGRKHRTSKRNRRRRDGSEEKE